MVHPSWHLIGRTNNRRIGGHEVLDDARFVRESAMMTGPDLGNDGARREPNDDVVRIGQDDGLGYANAELAGGRTRSLNGSHPLRLP
jgi:hypothetical protein